MRLAAARPNLAEGAVNYRVPTPQTLDLSFKGRGRERRRRGGKGKEEKKGARGGKGERKGRDGNRSKKPGYGPIAAMLPSQLARPSAPQFWEFPSILRPAVTMPTPFDLEGQNSA